MPLGSRTTNAQKNAMPVTSPGIARGYTHHVLERAAEAERRAVGDDRQGGDGDRRQRPADGRR